MDMCWLVATALFTGLRDEKGCLKCKTFCCALDEDCKRRWRSIKDTYKRLIREGKLSAEAASSSRRCKWPLLNVLTFLNVVPGRKR
jgi:hypothetical protein